MPAASSSRRGFIAGAGALTGAAFATPAAAQVPGYVAQTVIGIEGPFSGSMSGVCNQMANGVRAAVQDANNERGGLDRLFGIHTFDDTNSVAGGIVSADFACQDQTVFAVIGHLSGLITDAALDQYANGTMPIVVPSSTLDQITAHGYRNVFRLPTRDTLEGRMGAAFMETQFKPQRPVVVTQDGYYGRAVAAAVMGQLSADKLGPKTVIFTYDSPNYPGAAQQIMALQPDTIYLAGLVHDMGPVVPILRASGYTGNFFGSQGFYDPLTVDQYAHELEGLIVSTSMPPLDLAPSVFYIKQTYERNFGALTPLATFAYAAAQVIIIAGRRTGATSRNALFSAIAQPTPVQTIIGSITFSTTGDPVNPNLYYYQVKNGKWRYFRADHPSDMILK